MNDGKVVGYSKFVSKKGNRCCLLFLVCPLSNFQLKSDSVGQRVKELPVYGDLIDLVQPNCIGQFVESVYEIDNDKHYLVGLEFSSGK